MSREWEPCQRLYCVNWPAASECARGSLYFLQLTPSWLYLDTVIIPSLQTKAFYISLLYQFVTQGCCNICLHVCVRYQWKCLSLNNPHLMIIFQNPKYVKSFPFNNVYKWQVFPLLKPLKYAALSHCWCLEITSLPNSDSGKGGRCCCRSFRSLGIFTEV